MSLHFVPRGRSADAGIVARALASQGRHAEAVSAFEAAIAAAPRDAQLHVDCGHTLRALGRNHDATASFERAAALEPHRKEHRLLATLHRGTVIEHEEGPAAALAVFEQATGEFPEAADAWAVLGVVQQHLGAPEQAQRSLAQALALDPTRVELIERLARAFMDCKQFEDAAIVYEQLLRLDPDRPLVKGWLLHAKYLMGDWLHLDRLQSQVRAGLERGLPAAEPFGLQGWCNDAALLGRAARAHAARQHPPTPGLLPPPSIGTGTRIRVGYLCGEFREQATSILLTEVLELHDRSRFEVFAVDSGFDDASRRRRRIEAVCEMVPIRGLSDLEAARRVRACGIDVLVNLNGYFGLQRNGVFSLRAAPVQVNYLGFPGTVGASYLDYLVADATVVPPEDHAHYAERIVTLPGCYQPNDRTRVVATEPATRHDAGLPHDAFVFCCMNNVYKILPEVFDVWMRLLRQVSGSVLLLYGDKPEQQANLRHEAQERGVAPDRLLFAPPWRHENHLRRLQLCDLFLDTWPYNAHTTGSDALWAGLPVLTCTGRSFASRVGASLLQAVGLPELVTHDLPSYEALALKLATEPGLLHGLRARLAREARTSALYDTPRKTRHLEAAFQVMVDRARAGLAPAAFAVPADA